ncbi:hypothetical protein K8O92_10795 [Nocardia asteroides]|nr:hypothetical protein K8O92_10795 [Nocardia asteroides]
MKRSGVRFPQAAQTKANIGPETGAVRINKACNVDGTRTVNVPLETVARVALAHPGDALLPRTRSDTPGTAYHFYKTAWQPAPRRLEALSRRDFSLFTKKAWARCGPRTAAGLLRQCGQHLMR